MPRIYDAVFAAAGRKREEYLQFDRVDPFSRVYLKPNEPFDLPSDRGAAIAAIRQLSARDASNFERLLATLDQAVAEVESAVFSRPITSILQMIHPGFLRVGRGLPLWKSYRKWIDDWFETPLLKSFFYGFPSYTGQSWNTAAVGAVLIPFYMLAEGVWFPRGGVAAIPQSMERLGRELGVEYIVGDAVTGIERTGHSVSAVQLASGTRLPVDHLVSNLDRYTFGQRWLNRPTEALPSSSYFTLHWGFSSKIPGLSHHTLYVPPDFERGFVEMYDERQFPTDPIVYLNETSGMDPTMAPPGGSNVFAVITCPADEPQLDWAARSDEYAARVRRILDSFGVKLPEPVFERRQNPLYFHDQHGNYRGSLYGVDERARQLYGMFPAGNDDPEVRNLTYCGGSVQPGAGLPMATLSGQFATRNL